MKTEQSNSNSIDAHGYLIEESKNATESDQEIHGYHALTFLNGISARQGIISVQHIYDLLLLSYISIFHLLFFFQKFLNDDNVM